MKKVLMLWAVTYALLGCQNHSTTLSEQSTDKDIDSKAMVVTANPLATKAGEEVLRRGGTAVDAAVAIEAMLSLVEPQSSGLLGGAYLVHYNAKTKSVSAYDGRETAPAGATPDMFLNAVTVSDRRQGYFQAKNSGVSVGVPGVVAMLAMAQKDHGKLSWASLFDDVIEVAEKGFPISQRLYSAYTKYKWIFPTTPKQGPLDVFHYFYDSKGEPLPKGHILKNPEYAQTLNALKENPRYFYAGDFAQQVVAKVSQLPRPGSMSLQDLANYQPKKYEALCSPYKSYVLCGPPPSSSWIAVAMSMALMDHGPSYSDMGVDDPRNWAIMADAQRLAYVDRDQFVADPAYVDIPLNGMLNPTYLAQRASLITPNKAIESVSAGDPWAYEDKVSRLYGRDLTNDLPSTTHFVVRDSQGNVVSMTASVESIFGASRMVGGMMLNNQLTDFSFNPSDKAGKAIANAVEAGKRPRSSMSPTIVLDKHNDFVMATGSPGGNSIIAYTVKSLVGILDWQLTPEETVALPNMVARGDTVRLESDRTSDTLISAMRKMGFNVKASSGENSGLSIIVNTEKGLAGAADPRREGTVAVINTIRH